MGEAGTGKSCLIKRYCEEKFVSKYISTIGVDFGGTLFPCTHKYTKKSTRFLCILMRMTCFRCLAVKSIVVDNHQVKANFWDLAGAAEYFEVRNEFYRDAQVCVCDCLCLCLCICTKSDQMCAHLGMLIICLFETYQPCAQANYLDNLYIFIYSHE